MRNCFRSSMSAIAESSRVDRALQPAAVLVAMSEPPKPAWSAWQNRFRATKPICANRAWIRRHCYPTTAIPLFRKPSHSRSSDGALCARRCGQDTPPPPQLHRDAPGPTRSPPGKNAARPDPFVRPPFFLLIGRGAAYPRSPGARRSMGVSSRSHEPRRNTQHPRTLTAIVLGVRIQRALWSMPFSRRGSLKIPLRNSGLSWRTLDGLTRPISAKSRNQSPGSRPRRANACPLIRQQLLRGAS